MTPGVAASVNEVRAAASSLVTRSAGSAFIVEAGIAGVVTTLSTSLTHVEAAPAAVFTGAAVLAGVAVLEGQVRREFNPNVALEYGFMRALDKRVLLLTEKNFKEIRADIGGVVRESFDARQPKSIAKAVGRWIRDLEKPAPSGKKPAASRKQAR